jgi:hypothetical protein
VLWLNAQMGRDGCDVCPAGSASKCFVAGSSASPDGPFTYEGVVPNIRYVGEGGVGDFALFQDDDAERTPYAIYKRSGAAPGDQAHRMTLQRLLPSLLAADPAGSAGVFGAPFVEAPAMFKRQGVYYAMFGKCCAFCAHGTGIGVYSAPAPLGAWTYHENIGCVGGEPKAGCGCGMAEQPKYNVSCPAPPVAVTRAQQNSVILTGGDEVVWTGDRWQSACAATVRGQGLPPTGLPAALDCVKAFDLQYWSALRWNTDGPVPLPMQVAWQDEITVTVQ